MLVCNGNGRNRETEKRYFFSLKENEGKFFILVMEQRARQLYRRVRQQIIEEQGLVVKRNEGGGYMQMMTTGNAGRVHIGGNDRRNRENKSQKKSDMGKNYMH